MLESGGLVVVVQKKMMMLVDWFNLAARETSVSAFVNQHCWRGLSSARFDPCAVFGRPRGFGFGWGQHLQGGVPAAGVVEQLDVVVDR